MGGLFKETFWQGVRGAIWFLTAYRKMWEEREKQKEMLLIIQKGGRTYCF